MIRSIELDGRVIEVAVLAPLSSAARRILAQAQGVIAIPDDGEIAPVLATLGGAYWLYAARTAVARARVLSDRKRAEERARLFELFLADLRSAGSHVGALCSLDDVREAARVLAALPDPLRATPEEKAA